ncbi:TerB N-terminal domain-containing protein [Actinomadura sp. LCR2-06]|uniref:TerB N-terminal domain-containing protein n=1 Tax=Actinomadura violacea TaxID=2819934 RepID=A0ABS3RNA7_9ACTN|nr:TerB N-terminal domain-containing protein [Actinomadura violacea]
MSRDGVEPALIDPLLPVDRSAPDWAGEGLGHRPCYSEIAPRCRAAYLRWLQAGRRHRDVSVGYAFLFICGSRTDARNVRTARATSTGNRQCARTHDSNS